MNVLNIKNKVKLYLGLGCGKRAVEVKGGGYTRIMVTGRRKWQFFPMATKSWPIVNSVMLFTSSKGGKCFARTKLAVKRCVMQGDQLFVKII